MLGPNLLAWRTDASPFRLDCLAVSRLVLVRGGPFRLRFVEARLMDGGRRVWRGGEFPALRRDFHAHLAERPHPLEHLVEDKGQEIGYPVLLKASAGVDA